MVGSAGHDSAAQGNARAHDTVEGRQTTARRVDEEPDGANRDLPADLDAPGAPQPLGAPVTVFELTGGAGDVRVSGTSPTVRPWAAIPRRYSRAVK